MVYQISHHPTVIWQQTTQENFLESFQMTISAWEQGKIRGVDKKWEIESTEAKEAAHSEDKVQKAKRSCPPKNPSGFSPFPGQHLENLLLHINKAKSLVLSKFGEFHDWHTYKLIFSFHVEENVFFLVLPDRLIYIGCFFLRFGGTKAEYIFFKMCSLSSVTSLEGSGHLLKWRF